MPKTALVSQAATDPIFRETYRLLSAALSSREFSIVTLAKRANINRKTAESWVYRNEGRIVERIGKASPKRGGGRRPTLWQLTVEARQQTGFEVDRVWKLLAESALAKHEVPPPNLDLLPDLQTANKLLAKAVALEAGAPSQGVRKAPDHTANGPSSEEFLEEAQNWLVSVTSQLQEWSRLGHHPGSDTHAQVSAGVAAIRDRAIFELRADLYRHFGDATRIDIIKLADWIARAARAQAETPRHSALSISGEDQYDEIIERASLRLKWALWDRVSATSTGDAVCLAVIASIARPEVCSTVADRSGAVAGSIVRNLITLIGTDRLHESVVACLANESLSANAAVGVRTCAHVLAAVGAHPDLSTDHYLCHAADLICASRVWKKEFMPLLARIKWSEPTFDRRRFLKVSEPDRWPDLLRTLTARPVGGAAAALEQDFVDAAFDAWLRGVRKAVAELAPTKTPAPAPEERPIIEPRTREERWRIEQISGAAMNSMIVQCKEFAASSRAARV